MSIGLTAPSTYDPALVVHTYHATDPDESGIFWQGTMDPIELAYLLLGGHPDADDDEDYYHDHSGPGFSYTRRNATLGFGVGVARHLGDRFMIYGGTGWAMAFDHEYDRHKHNSHSDHHYHDHTHLHYETSGLNLTAGVHWRFSRNAGIDIGYQSFYETVYVGIVFPF